MAKAIASLSGNRILWSDGSITPGPPVGQPIAVPTPYQSPQQGGNQAVAAGTTGPAVSASDKPVQTTSSGNVRFSSGIEYPRSSIVQSSGGTAADNKTTSTRNTGGGSSSNVQISNPDNSTEKYNQLIRDLSDKFNSLRGAYDSGQAYYSNALNALNDKRKQFETDYKNTNQDIFNQYQSGRGDLQGASRGADAATLGMAATQGIGESGRAALLNKNQASRYNSLNDLVNTRSSNDRSNLSALNTNKNWANSQESEINRGREDLLRNYQQGEEAYRNQSLSALENIATNAQNQKAALALALGQIGARELASSDVTGFGDSFVNSLNSGLASTQGTLGNTTTTPTENINTNDQQALLLAELRKRGLLN